MHQVRVTTPKGKGEQVAKLALENGIQQASVQQQFFHGPDKEMDVVSFDSDTPSAKAFIDALMTAKFFNPQDYSITAQNIPTLISPKEPEKLTPPFEIPATDVYQDLWAQNHVNATYFARAIVSSLLLAYGMIQNDLITMIAAMLFTPFLTQVLAGGFGVVTRQWRLAAQGGMILALSTLLTIISGAVVASMTGGPLQFDGFSSLLTNFLISLIVGIAAGVATGDITGRRELIAMAAAAQFAIYPAWFGIMLVLGLPDDGTVGQRWLTFLVNVVTMFVVAVAVYLLMRFKGEVLAGYSKAFEKESK